MSVEDISIVMPVYNHEATLEAALDSVLMQETTFSYMVHCLDDASTDSSGEILERYRREHPDRIKVYTSSENQGMSKRSIRHNQPAVAGSYWCLLPGDDFLLDPRKLDKQVSFLEQNSDYTGCSCNTLMKNEITGEEVIIKPDRNSWNLLDLLLLKDRYAFYVHTTSVIWRNIYRRKGGFFPPQFDDDKVHGDVMLMQFMLARMGLVCNIPEVMSCYRITGKGVWTSKSVSEQHEINQTLEDIVLRKLPLRMKLILRLQEYRGRKEIYKKLIPGPVNE